VHLVGFTIEMISFPIIIVSCCIFSSRHKYEKRQCLRKFAYLLVAMNINNNWYQIHPIMIQQPRYAYKPTALQPILGLIFLANFIVFYSVSLKVTFVTCVNFITYLWCVTIAGNISATTSSWWNNKKVTVTYMNFLSTSCDEDSIQLICLCRVVLLLHRGWTGSTGHRIWEMTVLMKLRRIKHRISYSYTNHNILRLSYPVFKSPLSA